HQGPVALAARPHAFTSCGSARSVTSRCSAKLASPLAARSATAASTAPITSPRDDRRRPGRRAPAGDVVAIPVEAVLGHALERRVVDIDDAEPLRVTERPLEVVEQAPDEVALHRC